MSALDMASPPPPAARRPPRGTLGPPARLRAALFPTPGSTALTLVALALAAWIVPGLVRWALIDAVWSAPDGKACAAPGAGACWAFVADKLDGMAFGLFPPSERWRVTTAETLGALALGWLLWPRGRKLAPALAFFAAFPVVAFVLLHGAPSLGLPIVDTLNWGGLPVTLVVASVGIVASLPLGILLALARNSRLPAARALATAYVETLRGVPFVAVLFLANTMLPLFLPDGAAPDRMARPLIAVVAFAAAYLCENVRGGMRAVPRGPDEAARALGLPWIARLRLVTLPQALRAALPSIVGAAIGLFKDTTLVAAVGIFDFLHSVDLAIDDPKWAGAGVPATGYAFAALVYFAFCFGMSRYAAGLEARLDAGKAR